MATKKGKSKSGKGNSVDSDDSPYEISRDLSDQFKGSLSSKFLVLVTLKDSPKPLKARIIACRLTKCTDFRNNKKEVLDQLDEASYDYYISFIDLDRRNDCWRKRSDLVKTDEIYVDSKHSHHSNRIHALKKIETEENHEHEGCKEEDIERHREATKIKTIERIKIGDIICDTWYYSPYPRGFHNINTLHVCEFCLSFFVSENEKQRHGLRCRLTHPPGDEIYRDDTNRLSVFEIDGRKNKIYGENLAYLAKLFLDHKKLWRDMEPFIFYVLCENHPSSDDNTLSQDTYTSRIVGYFSKEKTSPEDDLKFRTHHSTSKTASVAATTTTTATSTSSINHRKNDDFNLSCILVLPCHQRKGYGKFLISFSYELSLIQGKLGTPERPLSDLGRASYYSWWTQRIIECLTTFIKADKDFCISDITKTTGIVEKDILWTLTVIICTDTRKLKEFYDECGKPGIIINAQDIRWVPHKPKWIRESEEPIFPQYDPCLHLSPIRVTADDSTSVSSSYNSNDSIQTQQTRSDEMLKIMYEYLPTSSSQPVGSSENIITLRKVLSYPNKNPTKKQYNKTKKQKDVMKKQEETKNEDGISPTRNSSKCSTLSLNELLQLSASTSKSTELFIPHS